MGAYMVAGALAGFLLNFVLLAVTRSEDGYLFTTLGTLSGAVTAVSWSRSIRRLEPRTAKSNAAKSPLPLGERGG